MLKYRIFWGGTRYIKNRMIGKKQNSNDLNNFKRFLLVKDFSLGHPHNCYFAPSYCEAVISLKWSHGLRYSLSFSFQYILQIESSVFFIKYKSSRPHPSLWFLNSSPAVSCPPFCVISTLLPFFPDGVFSGPCKWHFPCLCICCSLRTLCSFFKNLTNHFTIWEVLFDTFSFHLLQGWWARLLSSSTEHKF